MEFKGKIILLTGAAGTGKSTLAGLAETGIRRLKKVDFGQLLLQLKRDQGFVDLTYEDLRRRSAEIITPSDVSATDLKLIESLPEWRRHSHILIDSHAVTKEEYGFRLTHYSFHQLRQIAFDAIVVTYCEPTAIVARRKEDPAGRPAISLFEAQHHMTLQEALAINYAVICGCGYFLLDTGKQSPTQLVSRLAGIINGFDNVEST